MLIDFYILETASRQKSLQFACCLIEQCYQNKQQVFIHTESAEEAKRLDNLLWTYRDNSFVPHNIYKETDCSPPPIQISHTPAPPHHHQVLLNLSGNPPTFYQQFNHVIEIVFPDPVVQQLARERYKHYRKQGCEINTHKIKATEQ